MLPPPPRLFLVSDPVPSLTNADADVGLLRPVWYKDVRNGPIVRVGIVIESAELERGGTGVVELIAFGDVGRGSGDDDGDDVALV